MPQKRLHRSRTEKMIAGVCGGIAEYLDVDPTIVRVLWVLVALLAGTGILLYLILWIVMPLDVPQPPGSAPGSAALPSLERRRSRPAQPRRARSAALSERASGCG